MPNHADYTDPIITHCLTAERRLEDASFAEYHYNYYGTMDEWVDAESEHEATLWYWEQIMRIFPGATDCQHGLSLSLCAGPFSNHYSDDPHF